MRFAGFKSLLICLFVSTTVTAQMTVISGTAELGEYDFSNVGESIVANEMAIVNPAVASDTFTSANGSSNASFQLDNDSVLALSVNSTPGPRGPDPIVHDSVLTLDLSFASPGVLHIVSPPPRSFVSLQYGETVVSAASDLEGGWAGDWPPDPDVGGPEDFRPRANYLDSISVAPGPFSVSIRTLGNVSRSNDLLRGSATATFTFVPEPSTSTMTTIAMVTLLGFRSKRG